MLDQKMGNHGTRNRDRYQVEQTLHRKSCLKLNRYGIFAAHALYREPWATKQLFLAYDVTHTPREEYFPTCARRSRADTTACSICNCVKRSRSSSGHEKWLKNTYTEVGYNLDVRPWGYLSTIKNSSEPCGTQPMMRSCSSPYQPGHPWPWLHGSVFLKVESVFLDLRTSVQGKSTWSIDFLLHPISLQFQVVFKPKDKMRT